MPAQKDATPRDDATSSTALFHGLTFHLASDISRKRKSKLTSLITKHGGAVSSSVGATQLVESERLDPERPQQVAMAFVEQSVASGRLLDIDQFSGKSLTTTRKQIKKGKGRQSYSAEDDARMLYFAKTHGWKNMQALSAAAWKLAERQKVTSHSSQSMHEHFRKLLQRKTPIEQREIFAKAFAAREKREEEEEKRPESPATTGPLETRRREVEQEKLSSHLTTPENHAVQTTPMTPERTATPPTPVAPVRTAGQPNSSKKKQKRQRSSPDHGPTRDDDSVPSRSLPPPESDTDSAGDREDGGVYFTSVWSSVFGDRRKRQRLQRFFKTTTVPSAQPRESDAAAIEAADADPSSQHQQTRPVETEATTESEADELICQLQLETTQDMPSVVHALYYCSGDPTVARAFLLGASPSAMWIPEDDLLLANLLVLEERFARSAVDEAIARGDFASMQIQRTADEILERAQFLR